MSYWESTHPYDYDELLKDLTKHLWMHFGEMKSFVERGPVIMETGEEATLRDVKGKEYIDWSSGNILVNLGHKNKYISDALHKQLDEMCNTGLIYCHPAAIILSKKLSEILPNKCQRPFLDNAGSEAVESMMKMARQYWRFKGKGGKHIFISRWMAYHGATMGAGSLTGMPGFHEQYGPMLSKVVHVFPPYCYRCFYGKEYPGCDFECFKGLEETIKFEGSESIVGVVGEPCFGGGGMIPPPDEYWPMVSEICEKYDILLLIDEILTGFGRTGKFFACEHWDLKPDIMAVGKGLSSGYLPISAACPTPEISETFWGKEEKWFVHGHSWATSCPLLCTAASACIDVMRKENMPEKAAETGRYMLKRLKELEDIPIVGDVRGLGLLGAVELVMDKKTKAVFPREYGEMTEDMLIKRGLMLWCRWGYSTFLACCPPLIITREQIDDAMEIIDEVLRETAKKVK